MTELDAITPIRCTCVGSWNTKTRIGFFTSELAWIDADGVPQYLPHIEKGLLGIDNVTLELMAAHWGIMRALEMRMPIQLLAANESNVSTQKEYIPIWKDNDVKYGKGWRSNSKKRPKNLELWQPIDGASEQIPIDWVKREPDERDGFREVQEMIDWLEHERNRQAAAAAIARRRS